MEEEPEYIYHGDILGYPVKLLQSKGAERYGDQKTMFVISYLEVRPKPGWTSKDIPATLKPKRKWTWGFTELDRQYRNRVLKDGDIVVFGFKLKPSHFTVEKVREKTTKVLNDTFFGGEVKEAPDV